MNFSNNYISQLTGNVAIGASSISVGTATGAPAANFMVRVNDEFMLVTSVSGITPATFTVRRAQEGSAEAAHSTGDDVTNVVTAEWLNDRADYPPRRIYLYDECVARTTLNHGFTQTISGTGASIFADSPTFANHPGCIGLSTGSTANGRVCLSAALNFYLNGSGRLRYGSISRIGYSNGNFLSDGTNTFTQWMGVGNTFAGASPNSGVMFRYTHSVNSGKWEAVTREAGVETAIDTGVAGDTAWHRFEWDINATQTEVRFYIDNALVATSTTNLPSATVPLLPVPIGIFKTVGTTARFADIDAFWYHLDLTTAR